MKTLVEATSAFNVGAGIGRYARNIISRLLDGEMGDRWVLVRARPEPGQPTFLQPPGGSNVRNVALPFNRRNADRVWHRLDVPMDVRLFAGGADALYSPEFMAPPMAKVPRMITVHDLAFLTHPATTTDGLRGFLEAVVPRQVARAERIAVVSNATRDDLIETMGISPEKVVVARNGVDKRFFSRPTLGAEARTRLGLPDRYLLMVGTIEPRKNHLNTLKAFERSGVGRRIPLVLAGRPGWAFEAALEEARRQERMGTVRLLDYVPDADLPGLYAGATAVLYPSVTEGFGLPVVEALASGTAVLTGTAPALREVGGPHAVFVDPDDIEGMSERIRELAETEDGDDIRRRQEWASQFSWDDSAAVVRESIREIARG